MTALLEVRHATRRFAGLVAVNDVSFTLAPGEILGLIGPNGASVKLTSLTATSPAKRRVAWRTSSSAVINDGPGCFR